MALACAGVLVLGLAAGPLPVRAAELSGTVLSVDVAGKKMVVLDQQTSRNVDLGVADQADIRTTTGKPLMLQDLKRGDRVGVVHNAGLATRLLVNQAELRGTVSSINPSAQKLTVIEEGTNREIEVTLNPGTRVETTKREALALQNIKTGDGINVVYSGAAPVAITINSKPPELKGHIKSIGSDMRSIVVTELGSGNDVTVAVTPNTTILSSAGKSIGINDLRKGDGVGIAHQASVASLIVVNPAPTR